MRNAWTIALVVWALIAGFFGGIAVERWRFDVHRQLLFREFQRTIDEQHKLLMELEQLACTHTKFNERSRWAWRKCV